MKKILQKIFPESFLVYFRNHIDNEFWTFPELFQEFLIYFRNGIVLVMNSGHGILGKNENCLLTIVYTTAATITNKITITTAPMRPNPPIHCEN